MRINLYQRINVKNNSHEKIYNLRINIFLKSKYKYLIKYNLYASKFRNYQIIKNYRNKIKHNYS